MLGVLIANAAHKSNNVLSQAAVSLSVVASRLSSPAAGESSGAELAARTSQFAAGAANGLEAVTELVQSMMALARPLPVPVDPSRMVADIVRVVMADAREGAPAVAVDLREPVLQPEVGPVVRLAIASGVRTLHRAGRGGTVPWVAGEVTLTRPTAAVGAKPIIPDDILRIVADAGVAVRSEADVVSLRL